VVSYKFKHKNLSFLGTANRQEWGWAGPSSGLKTTKKSLRLAGAAGGVNIHTYTPHCAFTLSTSTKLVTPYWPNMKVAKNERFLYTWWTESSIIHLGVSTADYCCRIDVSANSIRSSRLVVWFGLQFCLPEIHGPLPDSSTLLPNYEKNQILAR